MDVKEIREAQELIKGFQNEAWAVVRRGIDEAYRELSENHDFTSGQVEYVWGRIDRLVTFLRANGEPYPKDSWIADRERKAREETARKCADAVRKEFRVAEGGSDTIDRVCSAIMDAAHE